MATLEELAAAMLGADTQAAIKAENPYFQLVAAPQSFSKSVLELAQPTMSDGVLTKPKYSTSELLPYAIGSGLLSGILQGMGENYQTTLEDRYADVLGNAIRGGAVENPGLSGSLFGNAKRQGQLFRLQDSLSEAQEAKKFERERAAKFQDKLLDLGYMVEKGEGGKTILRQLEGFDPNSQAAAKKAAEKTAEMMAEDAYWSGQGGGATPIATPAGANLNPNSPQYKRNQASEDRLTALRKELQGGQAFSDYQMSEKGYRTMLKAISDPSSVSDLDFVYGAIQMIEPGMAVREGEQAAVANSTSIPEAWKNQLNGALTGESKLGPTVREGVLRLAARRFDEHARTFGAAKKFYEQEAGRLGIASPGSVTYVPDPLSAEAISQSLRVGQGGVDPLQAAAAAILAKRKGVTAQPTVSPAPTPLVVR